MRTPTEMPGSNTRPRWRRRAEARPEEIVAAALAEFAEKGFAGTRIEAVAARAGISKGTLYLYFASKAELFKAVVRTGLAPYLVRAEAMVAEDDGPTPELVRGILYLVAGGIAGTELARIIKLVISEAGNFPDIARFYFDEIICRGLAVMRALVERGIARGEFRAVDPDATARIVVAPLLFAVIWRTTFESLDGKPLDISRLVDTHLDIFLAGLEKEP